MFHSKTFKTLLITVLAAALATVSASEISAGDTVYRLDNGMEVILKENHSSPMVAAIIFVRSGSKYESPYENGITHFLEHLLFDGTVNLTREELDGSVRDLGGYINAFTRKEMTAYLVLMPRQYIDYGLTVQADMLFNSVFPEQELDKERRVVLEEIKRDKDSPGQTARDYFTEKAYANTDYNRPVLGYQPFIENIPLPAIIDYWKRFYVPRNMTALIIGDFDSEVMKGTVEQIFGGIGAPTSSAESPEPDAMTPSPATYSAIEGQQVHDTVANVKSAYVDFSIDAPHYTDSGYLAVDLLSQYLNMDEISPLMLALKGGSDPLATEAYVSLTTYEEFSRLEISAIAENPDKTDLIVSTIQNQLGSIASHVADRDAIDGIKTTVKCDAIYNAEKLHYLGFIIAPMMMTVGWDFLQAYPDKLQEVGWPDCQTAAAEWLGEANYIATVVKPVGETGAEPYHPYELPAEQVTAYFDTVTITQHDLTVAHTLQYPRTDSVSLELTDLAQYHHEVLDNGLTVIIKSNPDTRVFAVNVIGKGRTANEPPGQTGITDFVNRCIEKGTYTRDALELSRDLAKIGANITLYDNPWIPYDDRYTTRRYSFMKFETIDEYARKGFHLFSDMILYPSFDPTEVENVRRSMMGVMGRRTGSPSYVARDAYYAALFEGKAYANPIMGSPRTIGMITADDLKTHHQKFYSPSNTVLSIASNLPVEQVKEWVDLRFGRLSGPAPETVEVGPADPILETKVNHTELDKEQISIYIGNALPADNDGDAAAIKVATSILSDRLALNLREKQGLAYSVGANSVFDRKFGWFYSVIGTASANYQTALDGIILEIEKLQYDGPTPEEIAKAKNQIWGSMMRAKLSSINQAYYLGVDNYLGRPLGFDQEFLQALSQVSAESVRRVASQYFRTDAYVLATAGKKM